MENDYGTTIGADQAARGSGAVFVVTVAFLAILIIALFILLARRKNARIEKQRKVEALQITVPKQSDPEEDRRDPKEVIGVMEAIYSSMHHFYEYAGWKRFWLGQPTFSCEIVSKNGLIYFYIICPEGTSAQIERQIHAQYPDAHIEPTKGYDIFLEGEQQYSAVAAVNLLRSDIFPIKTYKGLENDPLNGITNSISKLGTSSAAIQVLLQPIDQSWQQRIEEALQNIQKGKSFHTSSADKFFAAAREAGEVAFKSSQSQESGNNEAHNATANNVRLTALQEQQAKLLVEKASKVGFKVQIRCIARGDSEVEAKSHVQTMLSSFSQYQAPDSNGFRVSSLGNDKLLFSYVIRAFGPQPSFILNAEELTSIYHFPNRILDTPNIHWLGARKLSPPNNIPKSGLLLGYSDFRGTQIPIHMNYTDRSKHFYMIGKTGVGKTVMFQNMILQDIRNGHGVCYMDPNGDAIEWILKHIPKERAEDVILFDPADTSRPMALNLLEYDANNPEQKTMVINEMISIFDKLYDLKATGGPIFEQYMRNAMLLIMDDPDSGSTLMEIPKVLADAEFRKMKLSKTKNQVVIDFWVKEAEKAGGEAALANIVPYVTSKLTQFTSNDIMRPIIGQQKSAFNFREAMDSRKIILVTLPKGLLGDINSQLLGMIISGKIQIAAFSRQNQEEANRIPFYLYVDEFQNFTSKTFATILSEARKYQLSLNITNQFITQLDEDTRNAVVGNVGTMLAWRIGAADADFLKQEFDPLAIDDMVNTEKYNYYIKLLIDGTPTKPFNAMAYGPDPHENRQVGDAIRQLSRLKYGRDRELVESEIRLRTR